MFTFGKLLSAGAETVEEWWAVRELLGAAAVYPEEGDGSHAAGKPGGLPGSEEMELGLVID